MKKMNLIKTSQILVMMFFAALIFSSCNQTKPLTQQEMEGYWVLKTMNGVDAKTEFAGALPTLQFNFEDKTISGTGGCNRYTGGYTYEEGFLSAPNLAVTRMLCMEENNEAQFIQELSKEKSTLSIVNNLLTVVRDGKVVLEFEKGTAPVSTENLIPISQNLEGTWVLKTINGVSASDKYTQEGGKVPTILFDFAENRVFGNGGCNNYNSTFSLNENQLVVGLISTTQMACPNLEGESEFMQAIGDTSRIVLPNEGVLQLMKKDVVSVEFERITE